MLTDPFVSPGCSVQQALREPPGRKFITESAGPSAMATGCAVPPGVIMPAVGPGHIINGFLKPGSGACVFVNVLVFVRILESKLWDKLDHSAV